jgi:uncharacterized integral membrane protein
MKVLAWLVRVALFLAALGFALSNTGITELRFFGVDLVWRAPLVVFLLGFFVAGVALGFAGVVPTLFRQRRELSRLRREVRGASRPTSGLPADAPVSGSPPLGKP